MLRSSTLSMVFSFLLGATADGSEGFALARHRSYAWNADRIGLRAVQGFVLTMAVMYVLLNLMIDIL